MSLVEYFDKLKISILEEIKRQCDDLIDDTLPNSQKIAEKIYEYTSRGKLLRAYLVCFAVESFGHKLDKATLQTAAAIELAQTALLIHDDIMDNDDIRRNKPSMHKIFEQELNNTSHKEEIAKSLAMCVGDIALFHLFTYIADHKELVQLFSKELSKTALGQAFEIEKANQDREISKNDILLIIQQKTANYTFLLPLLSGMILASASTKDRAYITQFSMLAGLIFQIKDDEFNYLSSAQTGKSSGGDIRENKKTLCRFELLQEYPQIKDLFGKAEHITQIQELYHSSKSKKSIAQELADYKQKAEGIIRKMSIVSEYKILWNELLEYLMRRKY